MPFLLQSDRGRAPHACRPPAFDVHHVRLEATYKALQRRLHPDKYSTASPVSTLPPLHMLHCKVTPLSSSCVPPACALVRYCAWAEAVL